VSELVSLRPNFGLLAASLRRSASKHALSVGRLASGVRIQRAADDVAAMSISTRMNTSLTTSRSAIANLSQASSLLQVASGALSEIDSALNRMQALAVQAGSGVLTGAERGFLDIEFQALRAEVSRILKNTNFNGLPLFPQQPSAVTFKSQDITFSPDLIDDIILWVDAGDMDTVLDAAGRNARDPLFSGSVATVLDKSIAQNNLSQTNAAERPTYVYNAQNDLGILQFDGANDRMLGTVPAIGKQLTVFSVFNRTGGGATREALFDYGSAAEGSRNAWFLEGTNPQYYDFTTVNEFRPFTGTIDYGQFTVISTIHNDTDVTGNLNGLPSLDTTISTRDSSNSFVLGDDQTSGDELTGNIAEFFAFERALNLDEQLFMEGYLAHKWGIEGELASTHPFKAYPPGIRMEERTIDGFETDTVIAQFVADAGNKSIQYRVIGGSGRELLKVNDMTGEITLNDITGLGDDPITLTLEMEILVGSSFVLPHKVTLTLDPKGLFNFPAGSAKADVLSVNMGTYDEVSLYGTDTMSLNTDAKAAAAFESVLHAVDYITARRANVGSKQASSDIMSSNTMSSMQNITAARGVLADTDIASESTIYALLSAQIDATILVAAQANSLSAEVTTRIIEGEG